MNEKDLKKWLKSMQSVELTADEKREGRKLVLDAIESPQPFRFRFRVFSGAMAAIVLFASGGMSYAAQSSLPGDFLYSVKVEVNEELKAFFLPTPEAKLDWEMERVEMRFEELQEIKTEIKRPFEPEIHHRIREEIKENRATIREITQHEAPKDPESKLNEVYEERLEQWFEEDEGDVVFDVFEEERELFEDRDWFEDRRERWEERQQERFEAWGEPEDAAEEDQEGSEAEVEVLVEEEPEEEEPLIDTEIKIQIDDLDLGGAED